MATATITNNGTTYTSAADVLVALKEGKIAMDVALALVERFSKDNKNTTVNELTFRVSEKGGISVYGLQRMPVTLYKEQWERLLSEKTVAGIRDFITANEKLLKVKEKKQA